MLQARFLLTDDVKRNRQHYVTLFASTFLAGTLRHLHSLLYEDILLKPCNIQLDANFNIFNE